MLSDQDLFAVRPGLVGSDHELEALKRYSDFDVLHKALVRSPLGKHLKGTCVCVQKHLHLCNFYPLCIWGLAA